MPFPFDLVAGISYLSRVAAAYLSLLALTAVWGLTFPLVQSALQSASPLVFVSVRFVLAGLLFPLLVWPRAFHLRRDLVWKGIGLGALLAGGYIFQTLGLAHTTAARSGFLTGTLVPMTPLFSWLLFRTRIGLKPWIAVLLAFIGTAVMSQPTAGGLNFGDILTLVCAASFALQVVLVGRWAVRGQEAQLTWIQIIVTAGIAALAIPIEAPRFVLSSPLIWALVITAIFATGLGLWGQLHYQPRISATAAAVIYAFEPVFAGLAAWLIIGDRPTIVTLIGAAFIVSGMLLSSTAPSESQAHVP